MTDGAFERSYQASAVLDGRDELWYGSGTLLLEGNEPRQCTGLIAYIKMAKKGCQDA
jgi:hypothetical protein